MNKQPIGNLAFALAFLSGCGNNNDSQTDTVQSPLVGLWETESCEQVEFAESDTIQLWAKGSYEFTDFGAIYIKHNTYHDSDCTLPHPLANDPEPIHLYPADTYQDLGETTLREGITGRHLIIELNLDGVKYPIDAYFTINQERLCFSENLTVEALRFGIDVAGSSTIDFEACLIRS
ncbi:MAG: hypothetical protein AB2708_08220 [Candidatus Thiodiazotropha taylori]